MKRISSSWLSEPGAQQVCCILKGAGYAVYFVGGCVRNELLGVPISDIDLATTARPEIVIDLAKNAGMKAIPTGIEHGTVTLIAQGRSYEVTTFRKDVETDGRRAVVQFSGSIHDDALRRDFTMNALYADPSGNILDPLNGLPDLEKGLVRFVEDPAKRIQEDYLRILRFFRFNAWYGAASMGIDPDGLAAISENLSGLDTLSAERLGREMLKMLAAPNPAWSIASMHQTGALARVLPGSNPEALPVLVHLEEQINVAPEPLRRLTSLGLNVAFKDRLRLSRKEIKHLRTLADQIGETAGPAELAYRHGFHLGLDVVLLRCAYFGAALPESLMENLRLGEQADFPVRSSDLIRTYTGAALGKKLKTLEARWIASNFNLSREELLA